MHFSVFWCSDNAKTIHRLLLKQSGYRRKDCTNSSRYYTKESNNPRKDFFPKNNNKDNSKNCHNQQVL